MPSQYASQLNQIANLQGSNMASDAARQTAAYNLAKLEYKNQLDEQKRAMLKEKRKHEGDWWKRGLGSAASGALTGALAGLAGGPMGIAGGALAGAGGGFLGSVINDKAMGGVMGPGFGMQMGGAAGAGIGGMMAQNMAQAELTKQGMSAQQADLSDAILSGQYGDKYMGRTSLEGGRGSQYFGNTPAPNIWSSPLPPGATSLANPEYTGPLMQGPTGTPLLPPGATMGFGPLTPYEESQIYTPQQIPRGYGGNGPYR